MFDNKHFQRFLEEAKQSKGIKENSPLQTRRKRQNPLGDFKFHKINEYF
jgi:hypothetical protein